jgi:phosphorylase kinase alpha/beta subunit
VNIGEIDPLNRRLSTLPKPETTVQIVLLAENDQLMKELSDNGIRSCTLEEVFTDKQCPVAVLPAKLLGEAYHQLGENSKMNLTGRAKNNVGVLGTGMLYTIRNDIYAFYPSFLDHEAFYLCLDNELLVDLISTDIGYLKSNWRSMGCPLLTLPVLRTMVGEVSGWSSSPMIETLKKIKSGYIAGVRVQLGSYVDFISTSCIVSMTYLESSSIWEKNPHLSRRLSSLLPLADETIDRPRTFSNTNPVGGAIMRSRMSTGKHSPVVEKKITLSPSLRRLQVAKGWSVRRHSYGGGNLLSGSDKPLPSNQRKEHSVMASLSVEDLIHELEITPNVYDQADIIHFLFDNYGKHYDTKIGGTSCTVESLLEELYEKVN